MKMKKKMKRKIEKKALKRQITDLEITIQGQQLVLEFIIEFCSSVANKDNKNLISYQQLYSPSADSRNKVCMLFKQIRESCQKAGV